MNATNSDFWEPLVFPTEIREAAYHEAGHAVVAHRLGLPVVDITISVKDDSWYGLTTFGPWYNMPLELSPKSKSYARRKAIATIAGPMAPSLVGFDEGRGCEQDKSEFRMLCGFLFSKHGETPEFRRRSMRFRRKAFDCARRILDDTNIIQRVHGIAEHLCSQKKLSGAELNEILENCE